MPERCRQCERYEKGLKDLRERRTNLWRRGELSDVASETLTAEEERIAQEQKEHQAAQHRHSFLTPKTSLPEPSQNIEEKIRRRAYDLYVQRGRDDGHDLDDWLRAEAEMTAKNAKTTAA